MELERGFWGELVIVYFFIRGRIYNLFFVLVVIVVGGGQGGGVGFVVLGYVVELRGVVDGQRVDVVGVVIIIVVVMFSVFIV